MKFTKHYEIKGQVNNVKGKDHLDNSGTDGKISSI
jgi:hypothetical protein